MGNGLVFQLAKLGWVMCVCVCVFFFLICFRLGWVEYGESGSFWV